MDNFPQKSKFFLLLLLSFLQLSFFSFLSSAFSPVDNYLIDCGSIADATVNVDNRKFLGDSSKLGSGFLLAMRSISLEDQSPSLGASPLYHTARVFTKPANYEFEIKQKGTHLVRLHFRPLSSSSFNLSDARFHVSANQILLLSDFTGQIAAGNPVLKEYLIWVDGNKLVISFIPSTESSLAFVSAIEVISAPGDLIADTARLIKPQGIDDYAGLTKQALETVYRINVGGPKVTPFNDSLWRTWIPDDGFLHLNAASKAVYTSGRIKYLPGGASREVAPDSVYNTARVMNNPGVSMPDFNITWIFPVTSGYRYLVRMHFCDIASMSLNLLYFDVYINGYLAFKDLDLSELTGQILAAPYYMDFMVDIANSEALSISIGPSSLSNPSRVDAILNGVEIMKLNNSMGSLDGEVSLGPILRSSPRGNTSGFMPSVVGISLMIAIAGVVYRRKTEVRDYLAWTPLPVDASESNSNSMYRS
ncbi:probable receptor-like protein kinase At5g24010 [Macadamia integrifolia]|uniref:probable receptor-like protein kinase At5g24010 n=1 Tax=Macadamia integrifolia TaxID=60698 RepID=UPI001C4E3FA6|nr:probable receptor-like protein kinase At5g24010 [Macadamia integrifolia]